jgi:Asp-tRNA(Asn)/Glu-tRNA(Gln) amidotransferase A subunit family amidase
VTPIDLPDYFADAWPAHRTIMSADMAHRIGPIVERGPDGASAAIRKLIGEGHKVGAVDYFRATDLTTRMRTHFVSLFEQVCNAILTPATIGVAPKGIDATGNPMFCSLWTMTGLPAVTLPLLQGEDDMPLGVQLVGAPGEDARLLRTAAWLVKTIGGDKKKTRAKR